MKKIKSFFIILFALFGFSFCFSASSFAGVLEDSYKIFSYDADTIFLSSIAALNSANGFEIAEIQTKNGYILFAYQNNFYLLTVTKRYQKQTEVKILPQNSNYSDLAQSAKMVFSLIDYQLKFNPIRQVK